MRTKQLLSTLLFSLTFMNLLSQKTEFTNLGSGEYVIDNPICRYQKKFFNNREVERSFNFIMLDVFFAEKAGTFFNGTNDLSLQKYSASLNSSEKSISVLYNFDNRFGNSIRQLNWAFSGGAKFISENSFGTISNSSDGFKGDNVGIVVKGSYIGNGILNFLEKRIDDKLIKDRKGAMKEHRKTLYKSIDEKVLKYNNKEFKDYLKLYGALVNFDKQLTNPLEKLKKKEKAMFKEIADAEIKFMKENKLYKWVWNYWWSLDLFLPLGEKTYKITPLVDGKPSDASLYAFKTSLSGNTFIEWSSGQSIFLKAILSANGTNNIILNEEKATSFQTGTITDQNIINISPVVSAFDVQYDNFIQTSLKIEPAVFLFKNTIGFSPAIEFNFSEQYKATNWKLGLPVSLKDKEGKPKVNFELQWKQVSTLSKTNHIVGITTSFQFGDLIN